jgi:hypothetical protein
MIRLPETNTPGRPVSIPPAAEDAERTGRTLTAAYKRRGQLGLPDGRRKGPA